MKRINSNNIPIVDSETHVILADTDIAAAMCNQVVIIAFTPCGIVISIKHVVVKPANTAACVDIEL